MLRAAVRKILGQKKNPCDYEIPGVFLNELKKPWLQTLGIKTALDLGANIGDWSKAALLAFPDAAVYAFEPIPSIHEALCQRFKGQKRFHASNLAITNSEGAASFYQNNFSPSSSLLKMRQAHKDHFKFTANEKLIEVKTSKLDSVFERITLNENILIKMDVQGSELDAIQGGAKIFSKAKVVILEASFEALYEKEPQFDGLYQAMMSLGFKYHGQMGQLKSPMSGIPLQGDCIFLRP